MNKEFTINHIKELFCSYEQALALKELDFDEPCFRVGNPNGHTMWKFIDILNLKVEGISIRDILKEEFIDEYVGIPLKYQIFRWFREKGFLISLDSHDENNHEFYIKWQKDKSILSDEYKTYEEAESVCIDKLIELIKK